MVVAAVIGWSLAHPTPVGTTRGRPALRVDHRAAPLPCSVDDCRARASHRPRGRGGGPAGGARARGWARGSSTPSPPPVGLAPQADGARINLAAPVADGERVYVPAVGEPSPPAVSRWCRIEREQCGSRTAGSQHGDRGATRRVARGRARHGGGHRAAPRSHRRLHVGRPAARCPRDRRGQARATPPAGAGLNVRPTAGSSPWPGAQPSGPPARRPRRCSSGPGAVPSPPCWCASRSCSAWPWRSARARWPIEPSTGSTASPWATCGPRWCCSPIPNRRSPGLGPRRRLAGRTGRAARVSGELGSVLQDRLAGERLRVRGSLRAIEEPDDWSLVRHLAGRLQVHKVEGWEPADGAWRVANGLRRTIAGGASGWGRSIERCTPVSSSATTGRRAPSWGTTSAAPVCRTCWPYRGRTWPSSPR